MGQESPVVCRSALGTRGYSGCGCRSHPSEGSMALLSRQAILNTSSLEPSAQD